MSLFRVAAPQSRTEGMTLVASRNADDASVLRREGDSLECSLENGTLKGTATLSPVQKQWLKEHMTER